MGGRPRLSNLPGCPRSVSYTHLFGAELVDICKIDIEGAEYELFEFTPDEVLCKIRYLIVEFHDPPRTPPAVARLAALGFTEITIEEARRTGDRTEVRVFRGPAA